MKLAILFLVTSLILAGCKSASQEAEEPPRRNNSTIAQQTAPSAGTASRTTAQPREPIALFEVPFVETQFAGGGEVRKEGKELLVEMGATLTGVHWTNAFVPTNNFEVSLEAMKVSGSDFFCALTFPVLDSGCSLVLGGWGGGVVGLSSIDGMDASENETSRSMFFEENRWYKVRVRVAAGRITAWLDDEQIADVEMAGRKISVRAGEIILSQPLGVATYQTTARYRDALLRFL
jgi:hypothetical protein